jgi:hypothetical protein
MLHSRQVLALSAVALLALGVLTFGTGMLGTATSAAPARAAEAAAVESDADEDASVEETAAQDDAAKDAAAKDAAAEDDVVFETVPADVPPAGGKPKYDLQYKFKAGEVTRWEVLHRAVVDSTIQTTNQTAETRSKSVKSWRVEKVTTAGRITLVHSVESIDMWQKMQGRQEVTYNSLKDEEVPAGYEDVAKAVGVPLTLLTIDNRGTVLDREEKFPQPNSRSTLITIPLPPKPVPIGHRWAAPIEVEVVVTGVTKKIQTRQQFTLEKVADGLATISVDSQVLTPIHDPAIEAQLIQRLTSGSLKFDLDAGRIVSQQMDIDRRVIGFSGASSSMHYLMRFTEELLPASSAPPAKVAQRPASALRQPAAVEAQAPAAQKQPPANTGKAGQSARKALRR